MSESRSRSGTRPTAACQTRAFSVRAARHRHLDEHRRAACVGEELQREALRVEHRVVLELPAVERERLPEVAGLVEQPDADEGHTEVGRGLEVVARQHAEAAGVVRQHLAHAELHGEVADGGGQRRVVLALHLVPARLVEVRGEVVGQLTDRDDGVGVLRELLEPRRADLAQQPDRVVPGPIPRVRVERREQVLGGRVPAPPQVGGEGLQRCQRAGQLSTDGEPAKRSHKTDHLI